jgi:hypothetical protein
MGQSLEFGGVQSILLAEPADDAIIASCQGDPRGFLFY